MPLIEAKYGIRIVIDLILLLVVAVPILLFFLLGKPFERGFYCSDDSIRYPYTDSTVSTLALYLVGTLLPVFFMLLLEFLRSRSGQVGKRTYMCGMSVPSYLWSLYSTIGVFLFGCACSQLLTDVAKYSIGRLRPHFIAICKPDFDVIDCTKYVMPECHPDDEFRLKEARLSFPSGHASFSAFTMVYLVLYLQARLHVRVRLVRPFLQFVCLLLAFYTALSRVSDYKHHWSDVLFGSLLGTVVAILVWKFVSQVRVCSVAGEANAGVDWLPLNDIAAPAANSANPLQQQQHHQQLHEHQLRHQILNDRERRPCQYESRLPYLQTLQQQQQHHGYQEELEPPLSQQHSDPRQVRHQNMQTRTSPSSPSRLLQQQQQPLSVDSLCAEQQQNISSSSSSRGFRSESDFASVNGSPASPGTGRQRSAMTDPVGRPGQTFTARYQGPVFL